MSNYSDNGSQQNHDSLFDNLMQSLGLDASGQNIPDPTHPDLSLHDSFGQQALGADLHHSWNLGQTDFHSGFPQDLTHSNWSDSSHTSNFDISTPESQTGWTDLGHSQHYQDGSGWHQPDHYQTPGQMDYSTEYQPHHDFGQPHQMPFHSEPQTLNSIGTSDRNSVHIYSDGDVYWESGGKAGHIEGQKFYNYGDHYIGRLGADMKIYDAHDKCVGWVDPEGRAYTLDGTVFAKGGTARWAAAVLAFNTCSPA
ncbi:MAG: hypothetical protein U7127_28040 [Phormidium sp.]